MLAVTHESGEWRLKHTNLRGLVLCMIVFAGLLQLSLGLPMPRVESTSGFAVPSAPDAKLTIVHPVHLVPVVTRARIGHSFKRPRPVVKRPRRARLYPKPVRRTASGDYFAANIHLRKFPYPYRAMIAISSDADHQTLRKFNLIHQFLNTTQMTPGGPGLGLDIADSCFMYNGSNLLSDVDVNKVPLVNEFTYFTGTSNQRYAADIIDAYIHAGWIDTLHTYGDFSLQNQLETRFRRGLAANAIAALKAQGDVLAVWVDHGNRSNVDNFGSYGLRPFFNYQQGANPRSPYYHTNLLIPYGVRFVWSDLIDSQFGHDTMLYPLHLPDGRAVWGFWRYTNLGLTPFHTVKWLWTVDKLDWQLTPENLAAIVRRHQYAIVAQHLSADNEVQPLPGSGMAALRMLASAQRNGSILVARTSRLLRYNVSQQYVNYYVSHVGNRAFIHVTDIADPVFGTHPATMDDLRGITFYTPDPVHTEIMLRDVPVGPTFTQRNASDGVAPSIGVKWYARDTTDYSQYPPPNAVIF